MGISTIEQRKNKFIVVNQLADSESVNERELNAIAGGLVEGLIPIEAEKSRKGFITKSTIAGMIPLPSYFSEPVSKNSFLDVVDQINSIISECEKNLMNVNNLMLDFDYIFVDNQTKKIHCIFWPVFNNQNIYAPSPFFYDLPFRVVFTKHEEHDYMIDYLQYFKNQSSFTIKSFGKLIHSLMGNESDGHSQPLTGSDPSIERQGMSNQTKGNTASTGSYIHDALDKEQALSMSCPQCGQIAMKQAKYCSSCGTPLYPVEKIVNRVLDISEVLGFHDDYNETTILSAKNDDSGTTVLGADTFEKPTFPYLIREKTEEKINVDKPSFRIGKERRYCDYFVSNNNAVSRSHADIITKEWPLLYYR